MPSWLCRATRLRYALVVLPILRTTLLGGALAAAAFLTGFTVPEQARPHLARLPGPASGPLLEAASHPEWKQFLVLAAVRRANELDRLRELPGQGAVTPPLALATLPATRSDAEPEDANATDAPEKALQIDIGETSSTELPIGAPSIMPPVQKPQSSQPASQSDLKRLRKHRRARDKPLKPAKPAEAASNPFSALLGSSQTP
jgi:hypothetical protein